MATSEVSNIRFLAEQQLRVIDDLDRSGRSSEAARLLLARLMQRHEILRRLAIPGGPIRAA